MLETFYKPRWERFLARIESSLQTGKPLETVDHYEDEICFVYEKKRYSVKPNNDLKGAVSAIITKVMSEKIAYRTYGEKQSTFLENVTEDMTKQ